MTATVSDEDRAKAEVLVGRIAARLTIVSQVPATLMRQCVDIVAASIAAERERCAGAYCACRSPETA